MPDIKIMTWNIQTLGEGRMNVLNLDKVLASIITTAQVDICVIQEVAGAKGHEVMAALATACNQIAGGDLYCHYTISRLSGRERIGFLIRDITTVRPMEYTVADPPAMGDDPELPAGTNDNPLISMQEGSWKTWPVPFGTALPAKPFPTPKEMPVANLYAARDKARGGVMVDYVGKEYAENGVGSRFPAVALFEICGANNKTYLLPIIGVHTCPDPKITSTQVKQLRLLHLCQMFVNASNPPEARYLHVNGSWQLVDELMILGDFNIAYQDSDVATVSTMQTLTLSKWGKGGTSSTAKAPGNRGTKPADATVPPLDRNPITVTGADDLPNGDVLNLNMIAANTTRPTHMGRLTVVALNAYDNIFYRGTQCNQALGVPGRGNDAGVVIDIPGSIAVDQKGELAPLWKQLAIDYRKGGYTRDVGKLTGVGSRIDYTEQDRIILARLASDHLPITLIVSFP